MTADPFEHHPELRSKIADPHRSFFRGFHPSDFDERMAAAGMPSHWRLTDEQREATRIEALAGLRGSDLWVFGYGSLMWDPAFLFSEVRRAHVDGYARRFCLKDELGGRGSHEAPGLVAMLDRGPGCTGLAFRIEQDRVEEETKILWRREMLTGVYLAATVDAETAAGPVRAITFVANHAAKRVRDDLSREEQVRFIATGKGLLGSSLDYIANLAEHLEVLDIDDPDVFSLLEEAKRYNAVSAGS